MERLDACGRQLASVLKSAQMKRLFTLYPKLFTSLCPFYVCSVHMHAHLFIFFIFLSPPFVARRATRLCLQKSLRKQRKGKPLPSPRPRPCTNPAPVNVSGPKLYPGQWFFSSLSHFGCVRKVNFLIQMFKFIIKGEKTIAFRITNESQRNMCRNFCLLLVSVLHLEN